MPLRQDTPYRDENWHALSHQQFFLTSHFLDIVSEFLKQMFEILCGTPRLIVTKPRLLVTTSERMLFSKTKMFISLRKDLNHIFKLIMIPCWLRSVYNDYWLEFAKLSIYNKGRKKGFNMKGNKLWRRWNHSREISNSC